MRLLRTMLRIKRLEGEDMDTFLHRANGILKDRLANVASEHEAWVLRLPSFDLIGADMWIDSFISTRTY